MKEKIVLSILCCVVILINLLQMPAGPYGVKNDRLLDGIMLNNLSEEYIAVNDDGNLMFQALNNIDSIDKADNNLKLYSLSACVLDADTGRVIYEKNKDEVRAMASTTKILTCLLALEQCSIDDEVTVSEYAASMPDVQLNMQTGDSFRLYDLLLSLMLESHNDTAVAIAEHVGGSVEEFCRMMTKRARELGCDKSVFLTPNGLDKEVRIENTTLKHSTTANELALIMKECLKNEQFVSICRTKNAVISNLSKTKSYQLTNHNRLLETMEGAIAGKTGFTCDAGYCYVGAVSRNGSTYICALLGCGWPNNKNYKWYDMKTLIDFVQDEFEKTALPTELRCLSEIDGIKTYNMKTDGMPSDTLKIIREGVSENAVLVKEGERLSVQYEIPEYICTSTKKGTVVGKIYYKISGQTVKTENLTAENTVEKMSLLDYIKMTVEWYLMKNQKSSSDESVSSAKCES